ncbi:hypothetical protein [Amycolatopsis sp. cmx-4-68]|uniref:hypothetical protein n=1 Tax=Amycolatopsis sp. cmx-4-68 TaxID=2790938 RepID=UPI00397BAF8E
MGRIRRALAVALVPACLAACSTPAAPAEPSTTAKPATTVTSRTPTTTKPPPFTPPASPAKVDGACPFLGLGELQELLGTSEDLLATEQPADPAYVPHTEFQCRYEGKYVHPWLLDLWIFAAAGSYRPATAMKNYQADCSGPVTPVPGVGEGAYYCNRKDTDGKAMVITGKRSHGQNRLAIVYLLKHRAEVYTSLARMIADRL